MKLTARITIGFGILVALPAALILFQIFVISRMRALSEDSAPAGFHSALAALELIRDQARVEEYAHRLFAAPSPNRSTELASCQEDFDAGLRSLKATTLSEQEHTEVERLEGFWLAFKENLARQQLQAESIMPVPPELQDDLDRLRMQTLTVFQADLRFMNTNRDLLLAGGRRAEFLSWCVLAIGLLLGSLTALGVIRSISVPLRQLLEGTQALADGKDFVRLDTSRNDEISHIARSFNLLAERLVKPGDRK